RWQQGRRNQPNCFNTASVLIQPTIKDNDFISNLFQYSFCSYSTYATNSSSTRSQFQYSFCSYSTSSSCQGETSDGFNTASVLIQTSILLQLLFIGYIKTFEKSSFFSFFPTSIPFLSILCHFSYIPLFSRFL